MAADIGLVLGGAGVKESGMSGDAAWAGRL